MKLDSSLVQRAAPPGSMRYYAWLYTPAAQRDVMAALFLLEAELHETASAPHEVAHIRLQWWHEEFDCLIAGKARHPATAVLQDALRRFDSAQRPEVSVAEPFDLAQDKLRRSVLHAAAQELAKATYETDAELDQYFRSGLGNLFAMAMQLMTDAPSPTIIDTATQLGAFVRQVETLRDLRHDFHHGRLYLPLAELDTLGIEYEIPQSEQWPANFVQWLKQRCERQLTAYHLIKHALLKQRLSSEHQQALRPLLVLSDLHARLLQLIAADPLTHTQQRAELSPLQKVWTAWRSAFRAG